MKDSITGKTVLITGGTGGIGGELSKLLASKTKIGKLVVLSFTEKKNKEFVAELQAKASKDTEIISLPYDLSKYDDDTFLAKLKAVGVTEINHLVFTHFYNYFALPVTEVSKEQLDEKMFQITTLYRLPANLLRNKLIPEDVTSSITFTSGMLAVKPMQNSTVMTLFANAVIGLAKALALEIAPIRVNTILPGAVNTPIFDNPLNPVPREAIIAHIASTLPLKYVADPDEIVGLYLTVMESTYITGSNFGIDGGATL